MRKMYVLFAVLLVSVLSYGFIFSGGEEEKKSDVSKCPYLAQIHSDAGIECPYSGAKGDASECPYLSNKSESGSCPYSGEINGDKSKENSSCPYSGKSSTKTTLENHPKIKQINS